VCLLYDGFFSRELTIVKLGSGIAQRARLPRYLHLQMVAMSLYIASERGSGLTGSSSCEAYEVMVVCVMVRTLTVSLIIDRVTARRR
jgi:hypothetical protein